MKCPYCENEMERGYIQSRDGLGWNPKKRFIAAFSGATAKKPLGKAPVTYYCLPCQKMIIDWNTAIE